MNNPIKVNLISRSIDKLDALELALFHPDDVAIQRQLLSESGEVELDSDRISRSDVCILDVTTAWPEELSAYDKGQYSCELLVTGSIEDAALLRAAMKSGARDYLPCPQDPFGVPDELYDRLIEVGTNAKKRDRALTHVNGSRPKAGSVTVVVNSKGGSGATFLAVNLATLLGDKKRNDNPPLLVDLDIQFGDLSTYLDMPPDDGLVKALEMELPFDDTGINALIKQHKSGIDTLTTFSEQVRSAWDIDGNKVEMLISFLVAEGRDLIINMSNQLDPVGAAALELADTVLVVTEQSVPHLRTTRQMVRYMREMGVPNSRLRIVINRFNKKLEITHEDFKDAFPNLTLLTVPGEFKKVIKQINKGQPVVTRGRQSGNLAKAIEKISDHVWPKETKRRSLFGKKS